MRITRQTNKELELTGGGGFIAMLGCVFAALAAAFIIIQWLGPGGRSEKIASFFPAGLFFLAGLGMLLGRKKAQFNGMTEKAEIWWGLWPAFKFGSKSFSLKNVERVEIHRDRRGARKSQDTYYPVVLAGGGQATEVQAPGNYLEARRLAEALARFCGAPLHDLSEGTVVVREAGSLGDSFADLARKRGAKTPDLPPEPENAIASGTDDGKTLTVNIPAVGFTAVHKAAAAVVGAVLVFFLLPDILKAAGALPDLSGLSLLLRHLVSPFAMVLILLELFIFQFALEKTQITVTEQRVLVRKTGLVTRRPMKMKSSALEEFFAAPAFSMREKNEAYENIDKRLAGIRNVFLFYSQLVARNDKKVVRVFIPVPLAEAEYIAAIARRRLSGQG